MTSSPVISIRAAEAMAASAKTRDDVAGALRPLLTCCGGRRKRASAARQALEAMERGEA